MSIFTNILNKIFPQDHPANTASTGATAPAAPPSPIADPSSGCCTAACRCRSRTNAEASRNQRAVELAFIDCRFIEVA